jgi:hypothetical protein
MLFLPNNNLLLDINDTPKETACQIGKELAISLVENQL